MGAAGGAWGMDAAATPTADCIADDVDATRGEQAAIFAAPDGPAIGVGLATHILVGAFMEKYIVLHGPRQARQALAVEPDAAAGGGSQRSDDGKIAHPAASAGQTPAAETHRCGLGNIGARDRARKSQQGNTCWQMSQREKQHAHGCAPEPAGASPW